MEWRPPTPMPGKGHAERSYRGWTFKARSESHALDSIAVDRLHQSLKARCPLPEMIWSNFLEVTYEATGFKLSFTAEDALSQWTGRTDTGLGLPVSHSDKVFHDCDWTYSTEFNGSIDYDKQKLREVLRQKKLIEAPGFAKITPSSIPIPTEKLLRQDDMMFYSDVTLYLDELNDSGQSSLNVKIRVMPECFLIMQRLFVRIDHKCVRLWQWRFYHEFGAGHMNYDFESREDSIQAVIARVRPVSASMHPTSVHDERYAAQVDTVYETLQPNVCRKGIIHIDYP